MFVALSIHSVKGFIGVRFSESHLSKSQTRRKEVLKKKSTTKGIKYNEERKEKKID